MWGIGRMVEKNKFLRKEPVPMPLHPPQIQHWLTWDWTPASAEKVVSYSFVLRGNHVLSLDYWFWYAITFLPVVCE